VYTATRPKALVYVLRNVKEYKRSFVKEEDDDKGDGGGYNSNKDKDEDEDKGIELDKGSKDDLDRNDSKDEGSNDKDEIKKGDSNKNEIIDNLIVNTLLTNPNCDNLVKTICYKDVNLILLPNLTRTRDLLALKINLCYTKGY
jgi:hypothetical protein